MGIGTHAWINIYLPTLDWDPGIDERRGGILGKVTTNYKEIRKRLAHIDWNDKMKNKTATECWNILRGEIDSAIDSFVPMKMQGKRSKKKHLSKEAFRKIRHKQNMWMVYKHYYGKGSRLCGLQRGTKRSNKRS